MTYEEEERVDIRLHSRRTGVCCGMTWHKAHLNSEHTCSAGIRSRNLVYEFHPTPKKAGMPVKRKTIVCIDLLQDRTGSFFHMVFRQKARHTHGVITFYFTRSTCDAVVQFGLLRSSRQFVQF